jgi:transposase-like protein
LPQEPWARFLLPSRGMDWPFIPIEQIQGGEFQPRFCPWPSCVSHREPSSAHAWFTRHGVFIRQNDRRVVPRFRCRGCRRTFSQQSFAVSYYLKRPELSVPIAAGLLAGSAHRQLGRSLGCAPSTVTRRSARLGRHSLLLLSLALEALPVVSEPVVVDHFESFAFSQDHPFGLATLVGQRSWFLFGLDPAPHRRGGRRTPAQRRRWRERGWRAPVRGGYVRSFRRVLDFLGNRAPRGGALTLITDGHPAYRQALAGHHSRERFHHRAYPNPPRGPMGAPRSREARVRDVELFASDLLHSLIRHSCAHHRRETIAFGRRLNALLERAALLAVWRNFVKRRSERRRGVATPAMLLGLARDAWNWPRVMARRLFPSRVRVPEPWMKTYRREWVVPGIGTTRPHLLTRAF